MVIFSHTRDTDYVSICKIVLNISSFKKHGRLTVEHKISVTRTLSSKFIMLQYSVQRDRCTNF